MSRTRSTSLVCLLLPTVALAAAPAAAQELRVGPYVQDVRETSAWILWETTEGDESVVEWGGSDVLGESATGSSLASEGTARIHEVELTGLTPATRYHYRVRTGTAASETFHFTTRPAAESEVSFRIVAVSDMQRDADHPDVYRDVIHRGILAVSTRDFAPLADDGIAFVLVPGDLVDDGRVYASWRDEFFDPARDLMAYVPFYPVLGNHERDADHYYRYFHLPGEGGGAERWWALDHGNVRVIGLDSNLLLLVGDQQRFLEDQLGSACTDDRIDFVIVQIHHAHVSELWPTGEEGFATLVVDRMNRFTEECGRPSAQLYGHTHGYSRGASRDHPHLWIDVASAGGNLDHWGEYDDQYDSDDVSVSQDEYGFVVLEVEAGDAPTLRVVRYGMGDEVTPREPEVRDAIEVRRWNEPPSTPLARAPRGRVAPACTSMLASDFADPDGDLHGATQWQVASSCVGFGDPSTERLRAHENWYAGEDTQAGDDLRDEPLGELEPGAWHCWRARYRDRALAWSEWSEPVAFVIDEDGDPDCDDPSLPPVVPSEPAGCGCTHGARGAGSAGVIVLALVTGWARRRRRR